MGYNNFPQAIRAWNTGRITRAEFRSCLLEILTQENLPNFLELVPPDILEELREEIKMAPATEEEWEKGRFYDISGHFPIQPLNRVKNGTDPSLDWYRHAVEILRKHFVIENS